MSGESELISADDLIPGKIGQAIHFHSGGRIYPAVDQPECFCSFYYCNGTMSLSLWARSHTTIFQHVITPRDDSGLVVAFNDGNIPGGWFVAKGIYIENYGTQTFFSFTKTIRTVTKIILFSKILLYSNPLLCERQRLYHCSTETQLAEKILIHASVIFSESLNSQNSRNLRRFQLYLGKAPL